MPPPNPKNFALSPSVTDLGLGDMLKQQLDDQTAELKKKRAMSTPTAPLFGAASLNLLGPGAAPAAGVGGMS